MSARDDIREEYLAWLYDLVLDRSCDISEDYAYDELVRELYSIEFYSDIEMDKNRILDGVGLRYTFGYEKGYDDREICIYLDSSPCSVLEMMAALAKRCESQIMTDDSFGNRTRKWFRKMLMSLGLSGMYNMNYNKRYVDKVIDNFLKRQYEYSGKGGLFALRNPDRDQRNLEIWAQMCDYLYEIGQ